MVKLLWFFSKVVTIIYQNCELSYCNLFHVAEGIWQFSEGKKGDWNSKSAARKQAKTFERRYRLLQFCAGANFCRKWVHTWCDMKGTSSLPLINLLKSFNLLNSVVTVTSKNSSKLIYVEQMWNASHLAVIY